MQALHVSYGDLAILCTIHQPSALLFESFGWCRVVFLFIVILVLTVPADRLLLLERGGETVYFGDIGPDCCIVREYFSRYGAVCPANTNPAEFILGAIGAGVTPRIGNRDWKDIWLDSPEYQHAKQEIAIINVQALKKDLPDKKNMSTCECV